MCSGANSFKILTILDNEVILLFNAELYFEEMLLLYGEFILMLFECLRKPFNISWTTKINKN